MKNKKNEGELLLSPKLAASFLADRLGEGAELWLYRLANWRRPGRSAPLQARTTDAGSPVYAADELETYARQKSAAAAFTELSEGNSVRCGAVAKLDDTAAAHVRVMFAVGSVSQAVYSVEAKEARRLARLLIQAAEAVERSGQ